MQNDKQKFLNSNNNLNTSKDSICNKDSDRIWIGVEDKIEAYYNRKRGFNTVLKVASVFLVLGVISTWIFYYSNSPELDTTNVVKILPGTDRAILTLEDGREIDLTKTEEVVLEQAGVELVTSSDGVLVYKISATGSENENGYNTISTPRGGQYKIILPDDSEVLLNASSSLRFPKNINSLAVREIDLTGEGFFSVKKSKEKPFVVHTNGQNIRVLGTVFNVNSYNSSNVITTLLEGSVNINNRKIIRPGQQGITSSSSANPFVKNVDVNDFVDWVNSQFVFRDERITSIMERLSRWYDFEVKYMPTADQATTFNGELSRYTDVQDILHLLSKTSNLKFEIKAKTIFVK